MRGIRGLVLWSCATEFMERTEDGNALSGSDGERPASGSLVLLSAVTVSKPSTGAAEPLSVGITVGRLAGVTLTFCSTAERMETGGSGAAGSEFVDKRLVDPHLGKPVRLADSFSGSVFVSGPVAGEFSGGALAICEAQISAKLFSMRDDEMPQEPASSGPHVGSALSTG